MGMQSSRRVASPPVHASSVRSVQTIRPHWQFPTRLPNQVQASTTFSIAATPGEREQYLEETNPSSYKPRQREQ
eukprot:4270168-Amphidinium_carterae.1